jgi:hypothetical protein
MKTIITMVGISIFTNYQKQFNTLNDKLEDMKLELYNNWEEYKKTLKM